MPIRLWLRNHPHARQLFRPVAIPAWVLAVGKYVWRGIGELSTVDFIHSSWLMIAPYATALWHQEWLLPVAGFAWLGFLVLRNPQAKPRPESSGQVVVRDELTADRDDWKAKADNYRITLIGVQAELDTCNEALRASENEAER